MDSYSWIMLLGLIILTLSTGLSVRVSDQGLQVYVKSYSWIMLLVFIILVPMMSSPRPKARTWQPHLKKFKRWKRYDAVGPTFWVMLTFGVVILVVLKEFGWKAFTAAEKVKVEALESPQSRTRPPPSVGPVVGGEVEALESPQSRTRLWSDSARTPKKPVKTPPALIVKVAQASKTVEETKARAS